MNPSSWNWGVKTLYFWAGICFVMSVWTYYRLPETKGKSYTELDILFDKGVSARKFSSTDVDVFERDDETVEANAISELYKSQAQTSV